MEPLLKDSLRTEPRLFRGFGEFAPIDSLLIAS
jgi:hypothetical protein